ncbi:MAG: hypothetical protein N4A45_12415 [Flavobacteriales bacterium]|jgi:hypothetical protein|nr:hypothetical protein [Flavobacteriales bacterium]
MNLVIEEILTEIKMQNRKFGVQNYTAVEWIPIFRIRNRRNQ